MGSVPERKASPTISIATEFLISLFFSFPTNLDLLILFAQGKKGWGEFTYVLQSN